MQEFFPHFYIYSFSPKILLKKPRGMSLLAKARDQQILLPNQRTYTSARRAQSVPEVTVGLAAGLPTA